MNDLHHPESVPFGESQEADQFRTCFDHSQSVQVEHLLGPQAPPPQFLKQTVLDTGPDKLEYVSGFDIKIDQLLFLVLLRGLLFRRQRKGPWLLPKGFDPVVVVTLGNFATKLLLKTDTGITRLRGHSYPWWRGTTLVPTYHPAAALRSGDRVLDAMRSDLELAREALTSPPAAVPDPATQLDLFSG